MKYTVIDNHSAQVFEDTFEASSFDEAIEKAWGYFNDHTTQEKNHLDDFYLINESETQVFDFCKMWNNRNEISNVACDILNADEWNPDDCRRLCEFAGLEKEWQEADGDTFETVVNRAADRLKVDIYYN